MEVLVVDDENDVKFLYEQRFRKEIRNGQVSFVFAHSGEDALQYVNNYHKDELIVLSDINMPGMDGLELLRMIKETSTSSRAKVVMISAYGDEESYQEAMRLGADDFLTKPVDFTSLKEKLKVWQ